jgi:hypothetical protein
MSNGTEKVLGAVVILVALLVWAEPRIGGATGVFVRHWSRHAIVVMLLLAVVAIGWDRSRS